MKVELLNTFGDDNMIVDVARVSYGREASQFTDEQNTRLIRFLLKNNHTSPTRHCNIQFRVRCSIYVERQLFKHQVGITTNSISGRYVDFSDTYYEIDQFRLQSESSKQGSGADLSVEDNQKALDIQSNVIDVCQKAYADLLRLGVSKEQARSVLPLSLETEFIWTGSLQAFLHLCDLRLKPDAQKETRDVVDEMLQQVLESKKFEVTISEYLKLKSDYGKK